MTTPDTWTVLKILQWTQQYFADKGIDDPRLDAEILLGHTLAMSRIDVYTHFNRPLDEDELARFKATIKRRIQREPVAYIVGEREFWSLTFKVDRRVLIPRPDTECVVELARERLRELAGDPCLQRASWAAPPEPEEQPEALSVHEHEFDGAESADGELERVPLDAPVDLEPAAAPPPAAPWTPRRALDVADIGTGTGCIAIALAHELAYVEVVATDLSSEALEVALENATALGAARVTLRQGRYLEPLGEARFDLIVSNPPYIAASVLDDLAPEVVGHEPRMALTSGETGLEALEVLAEEAWERLRPGGYVICEIGFDQDVSARDTFARATPNWTDIRVHKDPYSGLVRIVEARRPLEPRDSP